MPALHQLQADPHGLRGLLDRGAADPLTPVDLARRPFGERQHNECEDYENERHDK